MKLLLCAMVVCLAGSSAQALHTQARLLLAQETARPGDTVLAGVHLHMDAGWHTYWRNSGASGDPTKISWELPRGVTAGEIQWPVPEKLPDKDLTTYIYKNDVVLLVPLKLGSDLPAGPLTLKARVAWLECEVSCVLGNADVQGRLEISGQSKPSADAPKLEAWKAKLPKPASASIARAWWEKPAAGNLRPFILEWNSASAPKAADFYPDASEQFEVQPETERLAAAQSQIRLRVNVKKLAGTWPERIAGVAIEQNGAGRLGYEVDLPVASTEADTAAAGAGPAATGGRELAPPSLWAMLLYAFLGGLILNVMPCVLPVIALKILGFVGEAHNERRRVFKLGLVYTVGVLSSFLVLALVVVLLQAAGQGAGWGFQFANPYFLMVMTVLVTLIALNLFGIFEVTLSSRALTATSSLAAKSGSVGAFFNGLLTTVLATSCSAPFLAAALGFAFALKQPWVLTLILLTVGLGLASPYLLLSWQPQWLRFLPKPGPWMEKFKIAMGFPMLAAGVWLCSLLTAHYGDRAWWMAVFLIFLAVAAWIFGEFVQRGQKRRGMAAVVAAAVLLTGYVYAIGSQLRPRQLVTETAGNALPNVAPKGIEWQRWSPDAVAAARKQGRPVLVDFTAKWCPTCNTIVKPTLESESVRNKLKEVNAVALLADFTSRSAEINAELLRFRRAGVPLVLIYPANPKEPPLIFDLVTPSTVVSALERAARSARAGAGVAEASN